MGKPAKIFIVLLGIMLLFTVISRSAASFTVAQVRVEQPQARKIEHKVTGDGTVEKLLDQAVYAPADILVAKVNVRKGQNVKKGQTLAVLDMDSLKDKIRTISDDIEILQLQNDALRCSLPRQRKTVTGTRRLPVPKRITGIRSETMRMPSGTQRKM